MLRTLIWPLAFAAMNDAGAAAFADLSYGTALPGVEELDACFVARDHNDRRSLMSISRMSRGLDQSAVVPIVASAPLLLLRTSANLYASCL